MTAASRAEPEAQSAVAARWILAVSLAIVGAMAFRNNFAQSLTTDEAFTLHTTGRTADFAYHRAISFELQPPLYFVLLQAWRRINASLEFARAFSTICVMLAVTVLGDLSRLLKIGGRWWNLALLAALTPTVLWAGSDARVYGLSLLLSSLILTLAVRLWTEDRPVHPLQVAAFGLLCCAAVLTAYYAGFLIAGILLACLVFRRRHGWWIWPAMALALLPWIPTVIAHVLNHPGGGSMSGPLAPLNLINAIFNKAERFHRIIAVGLALVMAATVLLGRLRLERGDWFVILAGGTGVAAIAALRMSSITLVEARHWVPVLPGLLTVLALLVSRVSRFPRDWAAAGLLAVFCLSTYSFRISFRTLDWRRVAQVINAGPSERPIMSDNLAGLPLLYYLNGKHPLYDISPEDVPPLDPAAQQVAPSAVPSSPGTLERVITGRGAWLIRRPKKSLKEPIAVLAAAGIPGLTPTLKDSRGGLRLYLLEFASDTAADSAASRGRN